MSDTLILNSDAQPLSLLPLSAIKWQESIKLSFLEKVIVLEWYDNWHINTVSGAYRVPSVVMVKKYIKRRTATRLTRSNLYLRDEYNCQYCGSRFDYTELTYDHVIPQCMGGESSWENLVAACKPCNHRKADKIIKPINPPHKPTYWELTAKRLKAPVIIRHYSWKRFIDAGDAGFMLISPENS